MIAAELFCAGCSAPIIKSWTGRNPKWCSERCRRRTLYSGVCVDCGAETYNGTTTPPDRCKTCANVLNGAQRKVWTRSLILTRIVEWTEEYGEPPSIADWNPYQAGVVFGDIERAARFRERAGHWPTFTTVINEFGSWNAAVAAAGFTPRVAHGGGGNELRRGLRRGLRAPLTHCKHGHEYTPENTYVLPSTGSRTCRQCQRDRRARWLANRDAVAA